MNTDAAQFVLAHLIVRADLFKFRIERGGVVSLQKVDQLVQNHIFDTFRRCADKVCVKRNDLF